MKAIIEKQKVLQVITDKIKEHQLKNQLIVDTTPIIALKEAYNKIIDLE
jgi:hypothetical protein